MGSKSLIQEVNNKEFNAEFREWHRRVKWFTHKECLDNDPPLIEKSDNRKYIAVEFVGNKWCLAKLPDSLSKQIYSLCHSRAVSVCSKTKFIDGTPKAHRYIDDATTEAFAKVWRYLGNYNPDAVPTTSPITWIFRAAQQEIINHLKRRFRQEHDAYKAGLAVLDNDVRQEKSYTPLEVIQRCERGSRYDYSKTGIIVHWKDEGNIYTLPFNKFSQESIDELMDNLKEDGYQVEITVKPTRFELTVRPKETQQ